MNSFFQKIPGVVLCIAIAWLGILFADWIGKDLLNFGKSPISPIMLAILLGIILRNIFFPAIFTSGTQFCLKFILRLGIVFLGIRLSLGDIFQLGILGVPLVASCIAIALVISFLFSKICNISTRMASLIAVGSSICGATAILATAPIIGAKKEEIAYAVANITIFGILAMLVYPYLAHWLFNDSYAAAGLFLGTAIHETAQVAGAGLIYGQLFETEAVLNTATLTKLIRNSFMAIVIPLLAYLFHRKQKNTHSTESFKITQAFPLFIVGFILFSILRSLGDFTIGQQGEAFGFITSTNWSVIIKQIKETAEICLVIAMAAVGLSTDLRQLKNLGIRPFYVGLSTALAVGIVSLIGVYILILLGTAIA